MQFPVGTVAVHPNLGTRVPVASFSITYQLIRASNLATTVGIGVDPYFDNSVLQLRNEITKEGLLVDSSELKLGVDTVLEPGKFYYNPHLKFSYYCLSVKENKADMALIESFQHGKLLQCICRGSPKEWWWQFVEVTDEREIERLTKLYDEYQSSLGS